jgi:PAS domain S-box-containing protein
VATISCDGGPSEELALPRELLADLPAAVAYLTGPDLVISFATKACLRVAGERDVIGLPIREAFPELAAQGRFEVLDHIIRTGRPARGSEVEVQVGRGGRADRLFVDFVGQPVRDSDGGIGGVLVCAADVTAHVQGRRRDDLLAAQVSEAEERYRTLFETLPQGIICYQGDGSVLSANPAATRILGLEADAMITWPLGTGGQAVRADGTPYRLEDLPAQMALRTGQAVHDVIVGKPHANTGELRWLRVTAVPDKRDGSGRPKRAYAIFADLTEQFQAEASCGRAPNCLGGCGTPTCSAWYWSAKNASTRPTTPSSISSATPVPTLTPGASLISH